jgi:beta-galactosidase
VLNTDGDPVTVSSVPAGLDLLSGTPIAGDLRLGPHGCCVIKLAL